MFILLFPAWKVESILAGTNAPYYIRRKIGKRERADAKTHQARRRRLKRQIIAAALKLTRGERAGGEGREGKPARIHSSSRISRILYLVSRIRGMYLFRAFPFSGSAAIEVRAEARASRRFCLF